MQKAIDKAKDFLTYGVRGLKVHALGSGAMGRRPAMRLIQAGIVGTMIFASSTAQASLFDPEKRLVNNAPITYYSLSVPGKNEQMQVARVDVDFSLGMKHLKSVHKIISKAYESVGALPPVFEDTESLLRAGSHANVMLEDNAAVVLMDTKTKPEIEGVLGGHAYDTVLGHENAHIVQHAVYHMVEKEADAYVKFGIDAPSDRRTPLRRAYMQNVHESFADTALYIHQRLGEGWHTDTQLLERQTQWRDQNLNRGFTSHYTSPTLQHISAKLTDQHLVQILEDTLGALSPADYSDAIRPLTETGTIQPGDPQDPASVAALLAKPEMDSFRYGMVEKVRSNWQSADKDYDAPAVALTNAVNNVTAELIQDAPISANDYFAVVEKAWEIHREQEQIRQAEQAARVAELNRQWEAQFGVVDAFDNNKSKNVDFLLEPEPDTPKLER